MSVSKCNVVFKVCTISSEISRYLKNVKLTQMIEMNAYKGLKKNLGCQMFFRKGGTI